MANTTNTANPTFVMPARRKGLKASIGNALSVTADGVANAVPEAVATAITAVKTARSGFNSVHNMAKSLEMDSTTDLLEDFIDASARLEATLASQPAFFADRPDLVAKMRAKLEALV